MSVLTNEDRINLQRIISEQNPEGFKETTDEIRRLKHSVRIYADVNALEALKTNYSRLRKTNKAQFEQMAISKCTFLFNNYTNLFNRLMKDELDIQILFKFINILRQIEDEKLDQHEGSVLVGKILKDLYIDSVIKQQANDDKRDERRKKKAQKHAKPAKAIKNISWGDFKKIEHP